MIVDFTGQYADEYKEKAKLKIGFGDSSEKEVLSNIIYTISCARA